ncbi:MAG: PA domain-containing protein [Thermoleophilia bacterium]
MKQVQLARLSLAALIVGVLAIAAPAAVAHDISRLADDGAMNSGKEVHAHDQHGGIEGHLPPVDRNVDKVGSLDLFGETEQAGRIGDVSAKGNYAYLTVFREPTCERGGIQVVDIADPANPKKGPYIPSHYGTYAGEGSQVISLDTRFFKGDVLVYNNEICAGREQTGVGGVTLIDVTNPLKPKKLVEGFGDFGLHGKSQTHANQVHSAFAWVNDETGRAYVIMTDDEEATDTDIIEITNPSRPTFVAEYDLTGDSRQALGAVHGDAVFIHDEVVKKIGGRYVGLLSYWDGGYIKLDVTDPANAVFMADTDYDAFDPVRLGFGQQISPEGNAHQAEFTRDNELFVATDEDFDPFRVTATIDDGPYAGTEFTAIQGSAVPRIDLDTSLSGGTRAVGLACTAGTVPAPDAEHRIAVIERGVCDFTVKVQIVEAAGYEGAIVFNRTGVDGCETLISMLVEAGIPAVFVSRKDGFRILGASLAGYTCSDAEDAAGTSAPPPPTDGATVGVRAIFDGWGYVHLYDANTMEDRDQYFLPESQDPAYASGFGDLSVHEVATDPDEDLVYVSYYAGGLRVLKYRDDSGNPALSEVGAYIADGGSNLWGVEVHEHPDGQKYVLASDRDSGIWIFRYTGG